ncbi:SRPBCC family protein [Neopusillimonas aromaticivorans]|uniref:SRPBCC family protein n=1 Tax=Neopusillimonas aromaticivorans TaxID=2979868 RepID=UPI0025978F52|nr:SRPBCC family protein [Neopusillimonas aromaticivorans]WJJ92593.1 SRPBCC family protein [Neopusillimonas aromaticivorans]
MAWYLDLIFGLNEHGMEVLGPPQRFVMDADWKSGADNFSGDDYHLGTLHRSAIEIGAFPVPFAENMKGYHIQAAPGHSLSFSMAASEDEPGPKFLATPTSLPRRSIRHAFHKSNWMLHVSPACSLATFSRIFRC